MSYAKLFGSILDSTVWQLPDTTRLVWITMMAMKDQDGVVEASIPGLAKRAGVSIPATEEALSTLSAPDPYSRTPDHEGRRIAAVDGGWRVLNHEKYREKEAAEERRAKEADRAARRRDAKKSGAVRKRPDASGFVRTSPEPSGKVRRVTPSETEAYPDMAVPPGPDPDPSSSPSPDPGAPVGRDHEQGPPPVNRGWPRASGAAVPKAALPMVPNRADDRASSRVSAPDPDPMRTERSRLLRVLPQLHCDAFRAAKLATGGQVPDLALAQAERAIRAHLELQASLEGYEDRARHVIAVREAEAVRSRSLRYFGVGLWREPAWGMATTMEIDPAPAAASGDQRTGRVEPARSSDYAPAGRVDLKATRDGGSKP